MNQSFAFWFFAALSVLVTPLAAQQGRTAAACDELEHTSWFADVSAELRRAEYQFSAAHDEDGVWSAPNRAHDFRTRVSADGIEVVPRSADASDAGAQWKLVLATKSFGRVGNASELKRATLQVANARAELDHGRLTEWFLNEERGLEQGWTIASAPSGAEPLWIGLEMGGDLYLRIDEGGRSGRLVDAANVLRLRYTSLVAFDATGRELEARLAPGPEGVGISIDDAGAVYPLTVDPTLTGPAWTAESNQSNAYFGSCVATAGDVNGDGYSDVIVGARLFDNGQTNEGRAFVYLGSATGLSASAAWTAESNRANALFGESVATAGDVNGDGYSDVVVGARLFDNDQPGEGRAFVYLGSATGLSATVAWTAESDQVNAAFGWSVATAGDVNGDGYSDVVVGAIGYDNGQVDEGRAFVYLGSATGLSATVAWTAEGDQVGATFGRSVASAGDVNGDGYGDVIVGASGIGNSQSTDGRAFVYLGSATGLSATVDWTAESGHANAGFGVSVATAGDVNGDGYSDVIVGAFEFFNGRAVEGGAFVYLGSATGLSATVAWTAESNQADANFGYSVATAGDVNGDGYSDVIVGALRYANGQDYEGRVFVYLGSATGLSASVAWTAESDQANAQFGNSVATSGDVNGDGYSDVIVGAVQFDNGQTNEGRAFVYLGSATGLSATTAWTAESDQANAQFGWSVAMAGDVNGDGYSDVIVGAPFFDNGQTDKGRAFVYLGSATGLSATTAWTAESDQGDAYFGWSVAMAGDVNGDGYSDVIVGAPGYANGQLSEGRAFLYLGSGGGLSFSPAWMTDSDQAGAAFGSCVASAGDVNGDGFSDVFVGAPYYDNGELNEGRAFVYLGSSRGLATSAAWTAESDQASAQFGFSGATAGDVNADGYSDVIVGAPYYDNGQYQEGRALVYLGSRSGLVSSAVWIAESDSERATFGYSVATAGDVNGDGYSDVIVGVSKLSVTFSDGGHAYVYLGSGTGLSTTAAWTVQGNPGESLGSSLASAGDVNGDGYSDVVVGVPPYWGIGKVPRGRALLFLGSGTGLSTSAAWTADGNEDGTSFALSTATAGDVNGDGYSDVIVGEPIRLNSYGRAFVYLGNEGRGGWTLAPQQRRTTDAAPIHLLGRSIDKDEFRIRVGFERELAGFDWASGLVPKAWLEWEVAPLGTALDGSRIEQGAEQTVTGSPLAFNELVEFVPPGPFQLPMGVARHVASGAYHWRARVRTNNPVFPVTPWVTMPWNNVTETKLRVGRAPVTPVPH
jgi:hypothetical protein